MLTLKIYIVKTFYCVFRREDKVRSSNPVTMLKLDEHLTKAGLKIVDNLVRKINNNAN